MLDRSYFDPDVPDEPVEDEDRVSGYKYGKEYVVLTDEDKEALKIRSEIPNLSIMGFLDMSEVERHFSLANCYVIIPSANMDSSELSLGAIGRGMIEEGKVALVRCVKTKDGDPKCGFLIPDQSLGYPRLLLHFLPATEDMRSYTFPSLSKASIEEERGKDMNFPTQDQVDAMKDLVNLLSVASIPLPTNPVLSRINKAIISVFLSVFFLSFPFYSPFILKS